MKRKILAYGLITSMLVGTLAGCGISDSAFDVQMDGSFGRDGSAARRHRPARLRQPQPDHGVSARGLRHVRRDGAPDPRGHRAQDVSGAHQRAAGAQAGGRGEGNQPGAGQGRGRPGGHQEGDEKARAQRSLPLRQRQEVQELLRQGGLTLKEASDKREARKGV